MFSTLLILKFIKCLFRYLIYLFTYFNLNCFFGKKNKFKFSKKHSNQIHTNKMNSPLSNNSHSIRKAIVHLNNSSFSYSFDIKPSITFYSLKKIISAAIHLPLFSFEIYHNSQHLTSPSIIETQILSLFPQENPIHFSLFTNKESHQTNIKLKLKSCNIHQNKYANYFCRNCNISICSTCILNQNHANHTIIEKADYLQRSEYLIDNVFMEENMSDVNDNINENDLTLNEIQNKLNNVLLIKLHELVDKIGNNINNVINIYNRNVEIANHNRKYNNEHFKEYCVNGIDLLKEKIAFDTNIINDNIFSQFDKKLNEIPQLYKNQLDKDVQNYSLIKLNNNKIEKLIDSIYTTIEKVLLEQLNLNTYNEITNNIETNIIEKINQQQIIQNICENININTNIKNTFIKKEQPIPNENIYLMFPIENTNQIKIFNSETGYITQKEIAFPLLSKINTFLTNFAYCNFQNKIYISGGYDKTSLQISNIFLTIDPQNNNNLYFTIMPTYHECHSMIAVNNYIYIIGGKDTNKCIKYNLNTFLFEEMSPLLFNEVKWTMLVVYNDYLYSFLGMNENEYLESIERINIEDINAKWELVEYKNEEEVNLNRFGCGIYIDYKEGGVYFVGGKNCEEDELYEDIVGFSFKEFCFWDCKMNVNEKMFFKENTLHYCKSKGIYCNYINNNGKFVKIDFLIEN